MLHLTSWLYCIYCVQSLSILPSIIYLLHTHNIHSYITSCGHLASSIIYAYFCISEINLCLFTLWSLFVIVCDSCHLTVPGPSLARNSPHVSISRWPSNKVTFVWVWNIWSIWVESQFCWSILDSDVCGESCVCEAVNCSRQRFNKSPEYHKAMAPSCMLLLSWRVLSPIPVSPPLQKCEKLLLHLFCSDLNSDSGESESPSVSLEACSTDCRQTAGGLMSHKVTVISGLMVCHMQCLSLKIEKRL